MNNLQTGALHGIVQGRTIQLVEEPGFPDGQAVQVVLYPRLPQGEGLRQSAGGWADLGEELDRFLEETRQGRQRLSGQENQVGDGTAGPSR